MKRILLLLCCLGTLKSYAQKTFTPQQYRQDFAYFWQTLNDNYCYFDKKLIDWQKLRAGYQAQIDTVTRRTSFVSTLERALNELYDHHAGLRTNTPTSSRLVPTATDLWAEYRNGIPIITEVRKGFGAEKAGIRAGMQVVAINDAPADQAILPYLGHTVNAASKSYALRLALAGNHVTARKITLTKGGRSADYYPDQNGMLLENISYPGMLESRVLDGRIGYIRINNCLFDDALIPQFDSVLNHLLSTRALILDLRETPSGGNTLVARAILGRFITSEHFYQKHELFAEEKATGIKRSWMEIVSPRGRTYTHPVVILADHWTGSVGEGITIAFDGMKRATIIGTQLARLNGAVESFEMPNTKIGFNIPTERLYHINGTPRELYTPTLPVDVRNDAPGKDLILLKAIAYLNRHKQ